MRPSSHDTKQYGCPWEECESRGISAFGVWNLSCSCGRRQLYSTDSLRIEKDNRRSLAKHLAK